MKRTWFNAWFFALLLCLFAADSFARGTPVKPPVEHGDAAMLASIPKGITTYVYSDSSTKPAGEVLNILALGQSNMYGTPGTNVIASMPLGLQNGTDQRLSKTWLTWYGKTGDGNHHHLHHAKPYAYSSTTQVWGPEVFGCWTLANQDYHTVITKAAIGGVPIESFMPGGAGWTLMTNNYSITLSEYAALGIPAPGAIDVLWWGQGEQLSSPAGNYYADLTNLIAQIKTQYSSPQMKVVFMGLNKRYAEGYESDAAFLKYVESNPGEAVYVYAKDLSVRGDLGEEALNVHYTGEGLKELGKRMANATIQLIESNDSFYTIDMGKVKVRESEVEGELSTEDLTVTGDISSPALNTINNDVFFSGDIRNTDLDGSGFGKSYYWQGAIRGTSSYDRSSVVLTSVDTVETFSTDSDLRLTEVRGYVFGTTSNPKHSSVRLLKTDDFNLEHGGIWTVEINPVRGGSPINPFKIYRCGATSSVLTSYGTPIMPTGENRIGWIATLSTNLTLMAGDVVQCATKGSFVVDINNNGAATFYIREYFDNSATLYTAATISTNAPLIVNGSTNLSARVVSTNAGISDFQNIIYTASDGLYFIPGDYTAYGFSIMLNLRYNDFEDFPSDFTPYPRP